MAPEREAPDAGVRPPTQTGPRRDGTGNLARQLRDGRPGPACTAFTWRMAGAVSAGLRAKCCALEGLTPELSRAEGVGLND